jgi:hypothetical protein
LWDFYATWGSSIYEERMIRPQAADLPLPLLVVIEALL